jgi:hypothetical protein
LLDDRRIRSRIHYVPLTNGSGSGSRRPKNRQIRQIRKRIRIRIRNAANFLYHSSFLLLFFPRFYFTLSKFFFSYFCVFSSSFFPVFYWPFSFFPFFALELLKIVFSTFSPPGIPLHAFSFVFFHGIPCCVLLYFLFSPS